MKKTALALALALSIPLASAHNLFSAGKEVTHTFHPTNEVPFHEHHTHGKYSVGVGAGISNSAGSGAIHVSSRHDRFKLFALLWTDNNDNGDPAVVTTTTTQTYRYRNRKREIVTTTNTVVTPGDDGDTANLAVGAAYMWDYRAVSAGLGAAYVADDDTENLGRHFQLYAEASVKTPKNWWVQRFSLWHLSDTDNRGETFIGFEKEI